MMLIACSLALLVIYAGTKLLIQSKKEVLGKLYLGISWFLILSGLLVVMGSACMACMASCHGQRGMMNQPCAMKNGGAQGCYMMGGSCRMDMHHQMAAPMMMQGCSHGMQMQGCEGKMEGNCGMQMHGGSCAHHGMAGQCGEARCIGRSECAAECRDHMECKQQGMEEHGEGCMMKGGMKKEAACCKKDSLQKKGK